VAEASQRVAEASHIAGLDGLRGVAAIAVVFHHIGRFSAHGYLAVDFFFCLSGYVLALAYEKRFAAGLRPLAYIRLRIERLWPMIILGAILGLSVWRLNPNLITINAERPGSFWPGFVAQVFLIPLVVPPAMFVFNGPQWSLFFEFVVNALHAVFFRWLTLPVLVVVAAISILTLGVSSLHRTHLSVGFNEDTFQLGVARAVYGFTLGIIFFRLRNKWFPRLPALPFGVVALVLLLLLILPVKLIPIRPMALIDLAFIAVILPVVLMFGVKCHSHQWIATQLGRMSYPLYAVHYPFVVAISTTAATFEGSMNSTLLEALRIAACMPIFAIALALGNWVEPPLINWHRRRRSKRLALG
jgi:peptidoglycan/LPS O-acetylase OafA/YrhL